MKNTIGYGKINDVKLTILWWICRVLGVTFIRCDSDECIWAHGGRCTNDVVDHSVIITTDLGDITMCLSQDDRWDG